MKKFFISAFSTLFVIVVFLSPLNAFSAAKPTTSALAAVLISADTGEIIYSVNHDKKLPMASTTKIMTALLCIESGNLYDEFIVDSDAIKVEGSSMGLQDGDIVTKYALCCGMLLPSGNDSANAAAVKIAGSIENFAEMMNERAKEIGLTRTFFVTPSGLEGDGHGSSAYDMALLAREALKNDIFRQICSSQTIKLSFGNPPYDRWLGNTNKLLSMYDGVYGVKTGFTDEAGRCLVSACERDGKRLICVTLNDKNDWNDHIAMFEYGFEQVKSFNPDIPNEFEIDIVGSDCEKISLALNSESIEITSCEYDLSKFSFNVISPPFVYAPINCGDNVAELSIRYNDTEVYRLPLCAKKDYPIYIEKKSDTSKKNFFEKIIDKFGGLLHR